VPCHGGGHHEKVGGHSKKFFPALRAGIYAPHFQNASGASVPRGMP